MAFRWDAQPKPIVALSPMADMTDSPFCLLAKRSGARIVFREMVSAEAIVRGNPKTLRMAAFAEAERPIVQQIFGSDPAVMAEAARIIEERCRPDGIDVNMGCPVYKMVSSWNGAALMKEPDRAQAILRAIKAAIAVPLSVKIRLGWSDPRECLAVAPLLEEAGADLLTVHGRTKTQGYAGTADWDMIGRVKRSVRIPVLANGDIHTPAAAVRALAASGADGVLVARGALGNPWVLRQIEEALREGREPAAVPYAERKQATLDHMALMEERYGERAGTLMRKHLAWYWRGFPHAQELRAALVRVRTREDMEEAYRAFEEREASFRTPVSLAAIGA